MKKILVALALGIVLVFAIATVASADNGPHGGWNGSTDACAGCHRAHSAISANGMLLIASDTYELCMSCHDGTGAFTDVKDGYYASGASSKWVAVDHGTAPTYTPAQGDAGNGLFGGGFVYARMLTNFGNASDEAANGLGQPTGNTVAADMNTSTTSWARMNAFDASGNSPLNDRHVTSTHTVRGVPVWDATTSSWSISTGVGTIWGSGAIQGAASGATIGNHWNADVTTFTGTAAAALECTSCHTPHGNAGRRDAATLAPSAAGVPYPSYRLLDYTPAGSNGFEGAASATDFWDTDVTWNATAPGGWTGAVVPEAAGVMIPDPVKKWYTLNNDPTQDASVLAYTGRRSATPGQSTYYYATFAGPGDYGGKYYAYRRPSTTASATSYRTCGTPNANTFTVVACAGIAGGVPTFDNTSQHDILGFWCSTCHDRYLAPGGTASRETDSGDLGYHYRHRSQGLGSGTNPNPYGGGVYTCVDCHNAHGTASVANSKAGTAQTTAPVVDPITGGISIGGQSYAGGSVLLKADNRAICLRCHGAAQYVGFFNITTSPTAPIYIP